MLSNNYIVWLCRTLSVEGHFSCLHFLASTHNAAVNICVQVFAWAYIFISPGRIPRNGSDGSHVTLCLTFWRTDRLLFSKLVASFYISLPLPVADMLRNPQWMPEITDSAKPYVRCVYIPFHLKEALYGFSLVYLNCLYCYSCTLGIFIKYNKGYLNISTVIPKQSIW